MIRPQTIPGVVLRNLRESGDSPFLTLSRRGRERSYTYAEWVDRARRWSAHFRECGLGPGDRVAVLMPHSFDLYSAFLGALLGGQVPAIFAPPSVKQTAERSRIVTKALICAVVPKRLVTCEAMRDSLGAATLGVAASTAEDLRNPSGEEPVVDIDPQRTAFLQFSSGTTGLKKGVAISHAALLEQVDAYARAIGLRATDSIASWLPLYHDMGLVACYFLSLVRRVPLVAICPFEWVADPAMLLEAITRHRSSLCWLPNFAYNFLARRTRDERLNSIDLSSVRGLVNCSEPILADSHREFVKRFRAHGLRDDTLCSSYAMAENTFAVTSGGFSMPLHVDVIDRAAFAERGAAVPVEPCGSASREFVSSGRLLDRTSVRIVDSAERDLPERHVGEIAIRSPWMLREYFRNPQATATSLVDDWYHTGDLGYVADGELYVTGRKKDLIIIGGVNLYPQDIESLVSDVPGTIAGRNVAFGVADPRGGTERIVVIAETHRTGAREREQLCEQIRGRVTAGTDIASGDVRVVDHRWLEKSTSGKIARAANRKRYLDSLTGAARSSEDDSESGSTRGRVLAAVRRSLGDGRPAANIRLDDETRLITSGLVDSLGIAGLVLELESEFGISLATELERGPGGFDRVASIVESIEALQARSRKARAPTTLLPVSMSMRDAKVSVFADSHRRYDALILGSSRSLKLNPERLNGWGFESFQFCVFSANAEDYYCILRFVLEHNRRPLRLIVLGAEPNSFSSNRDLDHRLLQNPALRTYLKEVPLVESDLAWAGSMPLIGSLKRLEDGARPETTGCSRQDRLEALLAVLRNQGDPETERGIAGYDPRTGYVLSYDVQPGVTIPRLADRDPRPQGGADPLEMYPEYHLRLKEFTRLNPVRLRYFAKFVELCRQHRIELLGFIPPFHPRLLQRLVDETGYADRRGELMRFMSEQRVRLFDFTDAASFGGTNADFKDGAHVGEYNADRLLSHLLDAARRREASLPVERNFPDEIDHAARAVQSTPGAAAALSRLAGLADEWVTAEGLGQPGETETGDRVRLAGWLSGFARGSAVVHLGWRTPEVAAALAGREATVVSYLDHLGRAIAAAARHGNEKLTFRILAEAHEHPESAADLVVLEAAEDGPSMSAEQAWRLVRPGGYLAVLGSNGAPQRLEALEIGRFVGDAVDGVVPDPDGCGAASAVVYRRIERNAKVHPRSTVLASRERVT